MKTDRRKNTGLTDRQGLPIQIGNVVHWSDGGDDLPMDERIATRWDRIAVVGMKGIMPFFKVIDSPYPVTRLASSVFDYGNFAYKDTENHLTIVATDEAEYRAKFKNAGECMIWVAAARRDGAGLNRPAAGHDTHALGAAIVNQ